jgi:hypothetical protein
MARAPHTDGEQIELDAERLAGRTLCIHHLWMPEELRTRRGHRQLAVVLALLVDDDCRFLLVRDRGAWLLDFLRPLGFRLVAGPDEKGVVTLERRLDPHGGRSPAHPAYN